ncbi:hypothetical protein [Paratractidigestivibacter sp.]|uniref:hypothetical protein n=1 Tax=Paratractidigestivibacter sp. TaxID=2847316 RepID=UPI002ABDF673|nr:hypothetical protein [Paratractidigestivibacter sp.]
MDDKIRQNLVDAGCDQAFIDEFEGLCDCAQFCRLKARRRELLDSIHAEQKKLDCLDYLIYQYRIDPNTK